MNRFYNENHQPCTNPFQSLQDDYDDKDDFLQQQQQQDLSEVDEGVPELIEE
jgi:hypothetical protein